MIGHVVKTIFVALGIGFVAELTNSWLGSEFLHKFLSQNLVTILIALLAINATTMGIVLTKVREMVDSKGGASCFKRTREQMLLSIKEQIALIVIAVVLFSIKGSAHVIAIENAELLLNVLTIGVFSYSLLVLYDTAKSVLIIIDFDG
ncbi:hypothetical protein O1B78_003577 [Vibrio cholerae]|uniref:Uncharacterized protein n=1 Tax=Vibrio cholerae TaxID=666 RepID=A0ABD7SND1_VIBCL|nr:MULTISPECIES: hypothetical protein [Gammaproteobacteria]EGR3921868.1 hypothetical protein [Vibrio cholerae]EKF9419382.1 hypothetical protein [Vibrio cholerae]MCX9462176.1 hypothetical protein [Vibrio cholerae]MVC79298.1 hypothetical protein [Vibrio cholerae]PAR34497.1 hypothetical protein CGT98_18340 [Vibrio metoecus]